MFHEGGSAFPQLECLGLDQVESKSSAGQNAGVEPIGRIIVVLGERFDAEPPMQGVVLAEVDQSFIGETLALFPSEVVAGQHERVHPGVIEVQPSFQPDLLQIRIPRMHLQVQGQGAREAGGTPSRRSASMFTWAAE